MLDKKRLFFGMHARAQWKDLEEGPIEERPKSRLISAEDRHLTLAFLGECAFTEIEPFLDKLPLPTSPLGIAEPFHKIHFLPFNHPRVVACELETNETLNTYSHALIKFLQTKGFLINEHRDFLPHVSLARAPFDRKAWKASFSPFVCILDSVTLYESLGNLKYRALWNHKLIQPFEEEEHTADLAFHIRGIDINNLLHHAQMALSDTYPPLLHYLIKERVWSLDEIIISLNETIAKADQHIGTPFKAVSYHGKVEQKKGYLEWEMIVDV